MKVDSASCFGKKKFNSYYAADRNVKMFRRFGSIHGKKVGIYRCSSCKMWHVGSTLNRKREVREV